MNPCGVPPQRMFIPTHPNIKELELLFKYINELSDPTTRNKAFQELSKRRASVPDLAPMLWFSFGAVAAILQEIVNSYPAISPPTLTAVQSSTVCNALALLQCIASHHETRGHFLAANIPLFLYPFLNAHGISRPFEYLKLTSLGVIGAFVKCGEREVITYLLQTEIIPVCLKIMDNSCDLSKTLHSIFLLIAKSPINLKGPQSADQVATFIMQKILLDDNGLLYTCETYERFSLVARTLGKMVLNIARELPNLNQRIVELLRHIVRCFHRLSENPRAREALRQCIPKPLVNGAFFSYFEEKDKCTVWLSQLVRRLEPVSLPAPNVDERSYGI